MGLEPCLNLNFLLPDLLKLVFCDYSIDELDAKENYSCAS